MPLIDFIEQRLKSDPVARKILAMDEAATRELDTQVLEQILIGHMMAIAGEANQIFRRVTMFDHGIDGEVEFKDNDGKASGKRITIQLKSGNSYLRTRKGDGSEVFDVSNDRHLEYWISQPVDVYLVIRQTDELSGQQVIRWMNVTRYLKARKDRKSRQIILAVTIHSERGRPARSRRPHKLTVGLAWRVPWSLNGEPKTTESPTISSPVRRERAGRPRSNHCMVTA